MMGLSTCTDALHLRTGQYAWAKIACFARYRLTSRVLEIDFIVPCRAHPALPLLMEKAGSQLSYIFSPIFRLGPVMVPLGRVYR